MKIFTKQEKNQPQTEFGGLTSDKIMKEIGKSASGKQSNVLTSSTISEQSKNALNVIKQNNQSETAKYLDGTLLSELAIKFADGNDGFVEHKLKTYIASNQGQVAPEYWYMLLDYYITTNNQKSFENVAITYSRSYNCSPPSWNSSQEIVETHNVMQNIIILQKLTAAEKVEIKNFFKKAKTQKYCRIDVSKLRFENSTIEGVNLFLNLMYELRKNQVVSLILQENIITDFCIKYMKIPGKIQPQKLDPNYIGNEKVLWLLYLEILQWKNRKEEFNEIATHYMNHFEESATGWDDNGPMKVEASIQSISQNVQINNNFNSQINNSNIKQITNFIEKNENSEIMVPFQFIHRFDFTSSTIFFDFLKKFKEKYPLKTIELIEPNQFIITLFDMLEINQIATIKSKKY